MKTLTIAIVLLVCHLEASGKAAKRSLPGAGIDLVASVSPTILVNTNQAVTYTFEVTHPGGAGIRKVELEHPGPGVRFLGGDANGNTMFEDGETWRWTCTRTHRWKPGAVIRETTRVKGLDLAGNPVSDSDTTEVFTVGMNVEIIPSAREVCAGEEVEFTLVSRLVTEDSRVSIRNVEVEAGLFFADGSFRACDLAFDQGSDLDGNGQINFMRIGNALVLEEWTNRCFVTPDQNFTIFAMDQGELLLGGEPLVPPMLVSNVDEVAVSVITPALTATAPPDMVTTPDRVPQPAATLDEFIAQGGTASDPNGPIGFEHIFDTFDPFGTTFRLYGLRDVCGNTMVVEQVLEVRELQDGGPKEEEGGGEGEEEESGDPEQPTPDLPQIPGDPRVLPPGFPEVPSSNDPQGDSQDLPSISLEPPPGISQQPPGISQQPPPDIPPLLRGENNLGGGNSGNNAGSATGTGNTAGSTNNRTGNSNSSIGGFGGGGGDGFYGNDGLFDTPQNRNQATGTGTGSGNTEQAGSSRSDPSASGRTAQSASNRVPSSYRRAASSGNSQQRFTSSSYGASSQAIANSRVLNPTGRTPRPSTTPRSGNPAGRPSGRPASTGKKFQWTGISPAKDSKLPTVQEKVPITASPVVGADLETSPELMKIRKYNDDPVNTFGDVANEVIKAIPGDLTANVSFWTQPVSYLRRNPVYFMGMGVVTILVLGFFIIRSRAKLG